MRGETGSKPFQPDLTQLNTTANVPLPHVDHPDFCLRKCILSTADRCIYQGIDEHIGRENGEGEKNGHVRKRTRQNGKRKLSSLRFP